MKGFVKWGGLAAAALVLTWAGGCGSKSYVKKGQVQDVLTQDTVQRKYFESIGIGAADPQLPSQTQRRALSRDAAIIKAHNEMLAMVKGAELESGQTVEQSVMTDQKMVERLKHIIQGAEIVKTEYTNDDGAIVTIQLPRKRAEQMLGIKFK